MKIRGLKPPSYGILDGSRDASVMLNPRLIKQHRSVEETAVNMHKRTARHDVDWNYNTRVSIICGAAQIICGLLSILLGSAAVAVGASHSQIGAGIWGGAVIVATGCLAIWSGRVKTHKAVFVCFVMSLMAALSSCLLLIIAGFGIAADLEHVNDKTYIFHFEKTSQGAKTGYPVLRYNQQVLRASIAVQGLMISVAMFELVASITQAVLCRYHRLCKGKAKTNGGDLAVIYETNDAQKETTEKIAQEHFIARDHVTPVNLYHVDEPSHYPDRIYQERRKFEYLESDKSVYSYSDRPRYTDSNKTEYTDSVRSSATRTQSDHNSAKSESLFSAETDRPTDEIGASAMDRHQEELLRMLLAQK